MQICEEGLLANTGGKKIQQNFLATAGKNIKKESFFLSLGNVLAFLSLLSALL